MFRHLVHRCWSSGLALVAILLTLSVSTAPDRRREPTSWPKILVARTVHLQNDTFLYFLVERSWSTSRLIEQWEIRAGHCHGCGRESTVIRLAHALGHDKLHEAGAEFRCLACAQRRLSDLKRRGIEVYAERELHRVIHDLEIIHDLESERRLQ